VLIFAFFYLESKDPTWCDFAIWIRPDAISRWILPDAILRWILPDAILRWIRPDAILRWIRPDAILRWIRPDAILRWIRPDAISRWIRPDAILRCIRQTNSIQFYANLGKSGTETQAMVRQAFREGSISRSLKGQTHRHRKRRDRWTANSRACSSSSLTSRRLLTKNSCWHAKHPYGTVTFYCDCVKMCEDFAANFGDKRTCCCIASTHHQTLPFSPGNFGPGTTRPPSPTHPTFLCFPQFKIKPKGRHFDTVDVMEAESQAVLNSLTEHDFHTVSFVPDGSTSPENYGWFFVSQIVTDVRSGLTFTAHQEGRKMCVLRQRKSSRLMTLRCSISECVERCHHLQGQVQLKLTN
jgi:hypothetical protein